MSMKVVGIISWAFVTAQQIMTSILPEESVPFSSWSWWVDVVGGSLSNSGPTKSGPSADEWTRDQVSKEHVKYLDNQNRPNE